MKRIVVVLINYYKEEKLAAFVMELLLPQKGVDLRILVVDNGSSLNDPLKQLQQHGVVVLYPEKNLGYFGAARLAWETESTQHGLPDYFVVSNFDLSFDPEHFFADYMLAESKQTALVSGPSIISDLNGTALNPMYLQRISLSRINRLLLVTSFYPFYWIYQLLHYIKRNIKGKQQQELHGDVQSYAIHGSMMFFTRHYFQRGGHLKFDSFLYGEELFVAEQLHQMGENCLVHLDMKVKHEEHSTTGKIKGPGHMKFLNQSLRYLKRVFFQ